MSERETILETLHEFMVENAIPIKDEQLRNLAEAVACSVEMFNELSSYGRPSGADMVTMHVRTAIDPLKRQIADLDAQHERELKSMTDNRDYWRREFYALERRLRNE